MRAQLSIDVSLFRPGIRVGVGLSGGADSVALTCALAARSRELGLVVHAAHLHHGLRGEEADADCEFARGLAERLGIEFHWERVDTAVEAQAHGETIEEAARRLRYAWFRRLMAGGKVDAVATAHTLDDQAETVLAKFLRGAWTEGLAGIYPRVQNEAGLILRPMLGVTRAEVEGYLREIRQEWREDSSNRHLSFTRNRIRHELLPLLEGWNPRLREHLAQMATLARDEEGWWQAEVARIAAQLLLAGKPVRGGGRSAGGGEDRSLSIETARLAALAPAMQRRLLRYAAEQLGAALDFSATEALRELALTGRASQRCEVAGGVTAERTYREIRLTAHRELRLTAGLAAGSAARASAKGGETAVEYKIPIPGEVAAAGLGLNVRIEVEAPEGVAAVREATLRAWRAGDRVRLRYSSGPRKVKEVLERLHVTGSDRTNWPVLDVGGRVVWMQGVEAEPEPGIAIFVRALRGFPST